MLLVPMALKELVAAFINLLDTVMLGSFGKDVIAAVGIANQWYFLFAVMTFGMCGGAGVFASQYWGAKDIGKVRKVLGINLILVKIIGNADTVTLGVEPVLYGVFTMGFDVLLLGCKHLFGQIMADARRKL